jgi:hypothetical protein
VDQNQFEVYVMLLDTGVRLFCIPPFHLANHHTTNIPRTSLSTITVSIGLTDWDVGTALSNRELQYYWCSALGSVTG